MNAMKKLLVLIFFSQGVVYTTHTQPKSSQELTASVIESLHEEDFQSFSKLILPREAFLQMLYDKLKNELTGQKLTDVLQWYKINYNKILLSQYKALYPEMSRKTKERGLKISNPKITLLIPDKESVFVEEKMVRVLLDGKPERYLYFFAVPYEGKWYLSTARMQIH